MFNNKMLYLLVIGIIVFQSCHPRKITYKTDANTLMINDYLFVKISNNDLLYLGSFYYSVQLDFSNKGCSNVYIKTPVNTIKSEYGNVVIPYQLTYLSDSIIEPKSEKRVSIGFKDYKEDKNILSDFFSNRKKMKKDHRFIFNLELIIGDSIVRRDIVFRPK